MSSYRYVLSIDNSHPERYKYSGRVIYHVGKNLSQGVKKNDKRENRLRKLSMQHGCHWTGRRLLRSQRRLQPLHE